MRSTIRRRWQGPVRLAGAVFAAALLLLPIGLTRSGPPPVHSARPHHNVITVNSLSGESDRNNVDLARAMALAAKDPRDNDIEFDPAVFAKPATIVLSQPVVVSGTAGKDTLHGLEGEAPKITIDATACPDAGFIVGGNGTLTLMNLAIQGGRQRAVLLKDKGHAVFKNVTVRSENGPGIALFGSARADLLQSELAGSQTHGIEVHGDCIANLQAVTIIGSGQSGIAGFDKAAISGRDVRLDRNGHWNLVLTGQSRAKLEGSTLTGAQFANVDLSEASRLDLTRCTIDRGGRFGVFATGHTTSDIADSFLRQHGNRGIEMQDSASLRLSSSEVDSNGDYGLILFEQCRVKAVDAKFTRNSGHGVSLRGKACGDFDRCLFSGNRYSGLGCLDGRDGGTVRASQCTFHSNGMRPIYRGPLHLDPLVPTPLTIDSDSVTCIADAGAAIELYLDRAGEASRYLRTIRADDRGRFNVSRSETPAGWVMTAAATVNGATSEFNVVAGAPSPDVIGALLARTGPLSDAGGDVDLDGGLRRWRTGTRIILNVDNPPSAAVERYARFLTEHVAEWTRGTIRAETCMGPSPAVGRDSVVVPVRYMPADAVPLLGRGGVTYMKWDVQGYFVNPMKILLASGKEPAETCPRVLAHEFGHVLGLCHARVGLLSRMQGSTPPSEAFINDFSPMLTFYDVLALHTLHSSCLYTPATLRQVVAAGTLPPSGATAVASLRPGTGDHPAYGPSPNQHEAAPPKRARRP